MTAETISRPIQNLISSFKRVAKRIKKHSKRESGIFKEEFSCTEILSVCVARRIVAMKTSQTSSNSAAKDKTKEF